MTVLQDAMFQVPHLPLAVTQVSKETIKAFSHSKKVGGYLLGRTLGVGSFAKVKEGLHISTGEKAAVKIIDKKRAKNDNYVRKNLRREGKLLQAVRHPNIVALLEIMETDNSYYLVTELCKGGDLMEYISSRKRLQEKEVLKFIRQIVSAVDYLHKVGIIHRDLKIENLLLDGNNDIKLIDFGLSNFVKVSDGSDGTREGELCSTQCGSPAYAAPELLNHEQYGLQVDSWSIGVNMFAMLTGGLPFTVEPFNIKALYVKMRDGQMNPVPDGLSKECRDLLRQFLTPDPARRVTIEQALVHPWITYGNSEAVQRVPCPNKLKTNDLNTDILSHMSDNLGFRMGEVIKFVTCNTPSAACATYHLYLTRLKRYQEGQGQANKKSNSTSRRSGVLDQRFPKNSQNDKNKVINNKTPGNNDDYDNEDHTIDTNDNDVSTDRNIKNDREYSPIASPSPQPKWRDAACSPPSHKEGSATPTTSRADHIEAGSIESPRSVLSDTSDRKENKMPQARENSIKFDECQHINRIHSPRTTYHGNRAVSMRTQQEEKATTHAPPSMVHRPRLYKRRGESTLASTNGGKFIEEVQETIEVLDVAKPSRGSSTVQRSDARQDLAFSRVVSPPSTARQAPGDQLSSKRGSDAGLSHMDSGDGTNNGAVSNRGFRGVASGGVSSTKRARDTSKSPVNFLQRLSDTHHQYSSRQDRDRKDISEDSSLGPVDSNAKQTPRSYLQNKKASMLARRAAALKELKPALNHSQDHEKVQGRLQEATVYGRVSTSGKGGRINPQVGKIIPRPFVPFRSAQERPSGLANSCPYQVGPPQKARTAESFTLRHENSALLTSRASGPPVESSETQPTGPPRPFIVRKRLVKRHRLGELQSLQPNLIQDIDQTVTATSFSSADAIITSNNLRKTPHMNDSLR